MDADNKIKICEELKLIFVFKFSREKIDCSIALPSSSKNRLFWLIFDWRRRCYEIQFFINKKLCWISTAGNSFFSVKKIVSVLFSSLSERMRGKTKMECLCQAQNTISRSFSRPIVFVPLKMLILAYAQPKIST